MPLLYLVIGGLIGVAGYREAEKFQRQYGRAPWGASAAVWGIVCFFFGLFGALFLVLAERGTKKELRQSSQPVWPPQPYGVVGASPYGPPPYGPPPAPPAYGQPPPAPPAYAPPAPPSAYGPPPAAPAPDEQPFVAGPNVGGTDFIPRR